VIQKNPEIPLVLTEGEFKSAAACAIDIPTLGLGGVYNWRSAKELQELLPSLEAFIWDGRTVYICFDSDLVTNPMVRLAASQLASTLAKRGAKVFWIQLPAAEDGAKQGLDDFIVANGSEEFGRLIMEAEELGPGVDLHRMNSEVAMVRATGEVVELATGHVWSASMFSDVVYKPRYFTAQAGGESSKMVVKWTAKEWLGWPLRGEAEKFDYVPGCDAMLTEENAYNTWWPQRPTLLPSEKGDIAPWEKLFEHVMHAVTPAERIWAKRWLAWPIAHPGEKMATAILVWGRETGTGKTLLGRTMEWLYGRNYGTVTNDQLAGQFNEWAVDKQFIIGDEISLGDKRAVANKLKDMITRDTYRVNIKGRKTFSVRDRVNYYFTSNHEDAMYLEAQDRRIFVAQLSQAPLPQSFYRDYMKWLNSGGPARLLHHFLHETDFGDFDPQARAPLSAAKVDMAAAGRGDVEDWCVALATNPDSVMDPARHPQDLFRTTDLLALYDPDKRERVKAIGLGRALGSAGVAKVAHGQNNMVVDGVRSRLWAVRNAVKYVGKMGMAEAVRCYEAERPGQRGVGASGRFSSKPQ
jgi:hypothetical protein